MRATLINRKRLVKCIIVRYFLSEAEVNNVEKALNLIATEDELRNKKDLQEIYKTISSDKDYIVTKDAVRKLLKELEFKNMTEERFEKLMSYCRHTAYELVYTKLNKCPWDYASQPRKSTDLDEYVKDYRKTILAVIEETKGIIPEILG